MNGLPNFGGYVDAVKTEHHLLPQKKGVVYFYISLRQLLREKKKKI